MGLKQRLGVRGGRIEARLSLLRVTVLVSFVVLIGLALRCSRLDVPCSPAALVLTRDQLGEWHFNEKAYAAAADSFTDLDWRAAALYRAGEFERAAGIWKGRPGADAAFNRGNALVMRGEYEDAVGAYEQALELRPAWADAEANRALALQRATWLEKKGGDMTGGKLGADEITFDDAKPPANDAPEEALEQSLTDADQRAIWLRQVETKPGDFLRARFAYEVARKNAE